VTNPPLDSSENGKTSGRRPPLTRARVLTAALRLVDDEGLDALTRRRLGQELGRDAMALYRHAPDRAALLDGIVELVMDELDIPDGGQDWQTQLARTAHDFRRIGLAHPHVVSLMVTRPLSTPLGLRPPGTLRPLERLLRVLTDAGFPPPLALRVYRLYIGFLYGHMLTELQEMVADPEETTDLLRLGLHRLPAKDFPLLRGLATELAGYDGEAELEQGLTVLFTGLRTELAGALHERDAASTATGASAG
jgi:AcrR family transcriptional regulator